MVIMTIVATPPFLLFLILLLVLIQVLLLLIQMCRSHLCLWPGGWCIGGWTLIPTSPTPTRARAATSAGILRRCELFDLPFSRLQGSGLSPLLWLSGCLSFCLLSRLARWTDNWPWWRSWSHSVAFFSNITTLYACTITMRTRWSIHNLYFPTPDSQISLSLSFGVLAFS